jgi:hypothetical protein
MWRGRPRPRDDQPLKGPIDFEDFGIAEAMPDTKPDFPENLKL